MNRIAYFLLGLLIITVVLAFFWLTHDNDPVNSRNFERIEVGMTQAQVEQILGGPGEEGNGDGQRFPICWKGLGRNVVTVDFKFEGQACVVKGKQFFSPGVWDRVKEWWGGYELYPDGSRSKRLVPDA